MTKKELMPLFEAARWAPSSYNHQPWRFIYACKGSPDWERFFSLLFENNQLWAKNAAVLALLISRNRFEKNDGPARLHSFDAGSAFENLALQGTKNGFVVHPMEGFDAKKAQSDLQVPEHYSVQIMLAIGKPGKVEDLSDSLREREGFTDRKPISSLVMEGTFLE